MKLRGTSVIHLFSILGLLCAPMLAHGVVTDVISVPWQGDTTKYHTTVDDLPVTLKGVIKTDSTLTTVYYKWVYGDGGDSGILGPLTGDTRYPVSMAHAYSGAPGTPFTAQLVVADNAGLTGSTSDPYLVKIETENLDSRINIAIDNGLWYLYENVEHFGPPAGCFESTDGSPLVVWEDEGTRAAATAAAIHAMQINGHKDTGDFDQDPYAEAVDGGLNWLFKGSYCGSFMLRPLPIGPAFGTATHPADDPDLRVNGLGIEVGDDTHYDPAYQGGQIMDAIIASGDPAASTGRDIDGDGFHDTRKEVIQDMIDMYSDGQSDFVEMVPIGCVNAVEDLGPPVSITFETLANDYWSVYDDGAGGFISSGSSLDVSLNGTYLATIPKDADVDDFCGGALPTSITVSDAGLLAAAWTADDGKLFSVVDYASPEGWCSYVQYVKATIDYGGGDIRSYCLFDAFSDGGGGGGGDAPAEAAVAGACDDGSCGTGYLCDGFTECLSTTRDLTCCPIFEETIIGAWRYSWNSDNDNSAAQWAAIGIIPALESPWLCMVPEWVKTYNNNWLDFSFDGSVGGGIWGKYGYTTAFANVDPFLDRAATTPSGMVQHSFVGMDTSDPRWTKPEKWIAENWTTGENWLGLTTDAGDSTDNIYATYAFAKAMRTAKPSPVVSFASTGLDWYRGSVAEDGVAKRISDEMIALGHFSDNFWVGFSGAPYILATAWGTIILQPELFAAAPIACFTAHPNPSFSGFPVEFDPSCSGHSEVGKDIDNLTLFEWDFDNDGVFEVSSAGPDVQSHAFVCDDLPCAFPVTLRVTDDSDPPRTATTVLDINITDPPHPPVSRPKSVYWVSACEGDTLTLDGSDSFDLNEGTHQTGCDDCPDDMITRWDWDLTGAPFDYEDESGEIVMLGTGYTAYFPGVGAYDIGLRVEDNTALAFPAAMLPNYHHEGFAKVEVYAGGPCDLVATGTCEGVKLTWSSTGADEYLVYCSTNDPNSDFVLVGSTAGTMFEIPTDLGAGAWYRVIARTGESYTMSKFAFGHRTFKDCQCITTLTARAKDRKIQLVWTPYAGAACYNIYRSTVAGFVPDPADPLVTCHVSAIATYLNTGLVNGTKYYYKVTAIVGGVETCISNEASATPVAPRSR